MWAVKIWSVRSGFSATAVSEKISDIKWFKRKQSLKRQREDHIFFFEVFRAQTKVERVVTFLYRQLSLALEGPEMQWSCYSQYPNLSNQYCKASTRNNEGFLSNERQKQDCPHSVRTKRFRSILKGFQCWTSNCIPSIYLFPCGCWECHSNFMPYFFPCFCFT